MPKPKLPKVDFEWTPKLAYAVGLLATDGNLSNDGRHIVMRSAEIPMLKTFRDCLRLKNKIGYTRRQGGYRVQFGDVQFYNWLLKIGLFPAKSYTIAKIDVPDRFFRDFLRGCIDGDGCIRTYTDSYNKYKGRIYSTQRLFIRIFSASNAFVYWIQQKTRYLIQVPGSIIITGPAGEHNVTLYALQFAKRDSLKLIKWIYYRKDLPCLWRKRKIAQKAVEIISKTKRREYAFIQ
jgi:hypothetical protein